MAIARIILAFNRVMDILLRTAGKQQTICPIDVIRYMGHQCRAGKGSGTETTEQQWQALVYGLTVLLKGGDSKEFYNNEAELVLSGWVNKYPSIRSGNHL